MLCLIFVLILSITSCDEIYIFLMLYFNSFITFFLFQKFFIFKDFIYLFLEREEGEREGEKHQCVVASRMTPHLGLACNPGMCPNRELNQQPFGLQAGTQSTEPHQLGPIFKF